MLQCASKDEREDRKPARADFDHQNAGLAGKSSTPCEPSVLLNLKEAQGFGAKKGHTSASLLGDNLYISEVGYIYICYIRNSKVQCHEVYTLLYIF